MLRVISLAAGLAACGGSHSTRDISEPPQRGGSELETVSARYTDYKPSIDAAGDAVVFISGRAADAADPLFKAYKIAWPAAGAPGKAERLTDDKIPTATAAETEAVLSPAGDWVALVAVDEEQPDLYLIRFSDQKAVRVTDNADVESAPQFSPDGKLLSWQSFKTATGARTILIADVSAAPAAPGSQHALTTADDDVNGPGFWRTGAMAPYVYVVQLVDPEKPAASLFEARSFAGAGAAEEAAKSGWLTGFNFVNSPYSVKGADDKAVLIRNVLASEGKQSVQSGDLEKATLTPVDSEPVFAAYDSAMPAAFEQPPGILALSVDIVKAGDLAVWVEREMYRCVDATAPHYGTGLLAGATSPGDFTRYVPLTGAKKDTWELSANVCDNVRADKSKGVVDDKIVNAVVAAGGTATEARVVYVSQFSAARDVNCVYKTGDSEVLALEITGGGSTKKIHRLSQNPAPLEDTARDEPCE
jgi:hypothetical protein